MQRPLRLVIALGMMAMFALVYVGAISSIPRKSRLLAREGVPVRGWVIRTDPKQHQNVHYAFRASGRTYEGVGRAGFGNPRFESIAPGDSVLVSYLPDDPGVSAMGDAAALAREDTGQFLGIGVIGCLVIGGMTFANAGRRPSRLQRMIRAELNRSR